MRYKVLNPTSEIVVSDAKPAPRLDSLAGLTVGFISNGKEGTSGFFAHLERLLLDDCGVARVVQRKKSNYSAPAERAIMEEAAGWDLAIAGIGD